MCGGGRTVVQQQPNPQIANQAPKPVIYMRNQWLDGLGINAEQSGRNSLRIDRGSPTPVRPMRTGGPQAPIQVGSGLGIGGPPRGPGGNPLDGLVRGQGINNFIRSAVTIGKRY